MEKELLVNGELLAFCRSLIEQGNFFCGGWPDQMFLMCMPFRGKEALEMLLPCLTPSVSALDTR